MGSDGSVSVLGRQRGLRWGAGLLAVVALARLVSLRFYPLMDPTEARYANIARVMLETGDWITPQTNPGAVFWGKPPLSTWASAASMELFGINELGARWPSFLFAGLTLLIVHRWCAVLAARAGIERPRDAAWAGTVVLATSVGFFVAAGAVMTDPALVFATTWALAAFWRTVVDSDARARWRLGFFAALGVGLLAKGPVAVVIVAIPIAAWCLLQRQWTALRSLPWLQGAAIVTAIAAPWYVVAELQTPGFLRYFLLGENVERFLVPGWKGDQYGFAHAAPHGIVWLYFVAATLPWSLVAIPGATALARARRAGLPSPAVSFVVLATLSPLAFFTLSSHLIWTYTLPSIPPFAVLGGVWLTATPRRSLMLRMGTIAASMMSVALAGSLVAASPWLARTYSTREIYHAWEDVQVMAPGPLTSGQSRVAPSLLFYSDGAVRLGVRAGNENGPRYNLYPSDVVERLAAQPWECRGARVIVARNRDYLLVREAGLPNYCAIK